MGRPKATPAAVEAKKAEPRKHKAIVIHVLPHVAEQLKVIADDRQTTVSQYCRVVLTDHVKSVSVS
jgi:hypothetical protein